MIVGGTGVIQKRASCSHHGDDNPSIISVVPQMNSSSQSGFIVTGYVKALSGDIYRTFNSSDNAYSWTTSSPYADIQVKLPTGKVVNKALVGTSSFCNIRIYGKNSGGDWVLLATKTLTCSGYAHTTAMITWEQTQVYDNYRCYVSGWSGTNYPGVSYIRYIESQC